MNSVTKTLIVALAAVGGAVAIGLDLGDRTGAPQALPQATAQASAEVGVWPQPGTQWVVADAGAGTSGPQKDSSTRKISRP